MFDFSGLRIVAINQQHPAASWRSENVQRREKNLTNFDEAIAGDAFLILAKSVFGAVGVPIANGLFDDDFDVEYDASKFDAFFAFAVAVAVKLALGLQHAPPVDAVEPVLAVVGHAGKEFEDFFSSEI